MKRAFAPCATGLALLLGLSAFTNPYDPAQRAIGGGLLGAGAGAAIGAPPAVDLEQRWGRQSAELRA